MLESKSTTKHSNFPTFHPSNLVEPFNLGSREISIQNLVIVLSRARAADGAPLAHADAVTRPGARRNQARHLTIHFRHSQLKGIAGKHAIDIGSQHSADVRAWDAYVAALDHVAVVRQDLPGRLAHCVPNLRTLDRDAEVDLVAGVGIGVEPARFPTTAVFHRKAAGDDHLREKRRFFVRTTRTDLGANDTG